MIVAEVTTEAKPVGAKGVRIVTILLSEGGLVIALGVAREGTIDDGVIDLGLCHATVMSGGKRICIEEGVGMRTERRGTARIDLDHFRENVRMHESAIFRGSVSYTVLLLHYGLKLLTTSRYQIYNKK